VRITGIYIFFQKIIFEFERMQNTGVILNI